MMQPAQAMTLSLPLRHLVAEVRHVAEEPLMERLRRRDQSAVAELCESHGPRLRRMAWALTGDASAAEDVAQETLMIGWESAPKARDGTVLAAWLAGIALNLCRQHLRKSARRKRREERAARKEALPPESTLEDGERQRQLAAGLGMLSQEERELLGMRYFEGLSVSQVARLLGVPEGTVKSRTHAAIGRLRGIMEKQDEQ